MRPAAARPPCPLLLGIALTPIFSAYILLVRQSVPIPLLDDYPSILDFAARLQQQPTAGQKLLYLVAAQHNEYKLILLHTVVALQLLTLHRISLSFLIALGNLAPLLILLVLWLNTLPDERNLSERLFRFLPVPFLLFQLNYAETFDWSMAALQNLGVIAFAMLAISLLLQPRRGTFAAAIASALLACSASAGAFLLAPIGLLVLSSRRSYRAALVWCLPFAAMLLVYIYRYVRVPTVAPATLPGMALFFLSFLGSAYENMHHRPVPHLALLLGAALLVASATTLRAHALRAHPFFFLSTLFVLGSAALASFGRAGMGLEGSLSSRYKIYSDLLLIFVYLGFAARPEGGSIKRSRRFTVVALVTAVLLCGASDVAGYKFLAKRRSQLIRGLRQYQASPSTSTPMLNPNGTEDPGFTGLQEQARNTLTHSIQLGLYRPPDIP